MTFSDLIILGLETQWRALPASPEPYNLVKRGVLPLQAKAEQMKIEPAIVIMRGAYGALEGLHRARHSLPASETRAVAGIAWQ